MTDPVLVPPANPWVWPVLKSYPITNPFGASHHAVDIGTPIGTEIWSPHTGKIVFAGWDNSPGGGYGQYLEIETNTGEHIFLGHLSELLASVGDTVQAGQLVGKSGDNGNSTGPHLHFEVRTGAAYGTWKNPIDLITEWLTAALSPAPGGAAAGNTGQAGKVSNVGLLDTVTDKTADALIKSIKNAFGIKDYWLKPINLISMLVGVGLIAYGVTGIVLQGSAKWALSGLGESIGKGISEGAAKGETKE